MYLGYMMMMCCWTLLIHINIIIDIDYTIGDKIYEYDCLVVSTHARSNQHCLVPVVEHPNFRTNHIPYVEKLTCYM